MAYHQLLFAPIPKIYCPSFFPLAIPSYGIAKANIARPSGKSMDSKKRYVVLHHFCVFLWKSDVIFEQVFPFPQAFGH